MLKGFLLGIPQSLEDAAIVEWARTNCSRTSRSSGKTVTGAARKGMITSNRCLGFAMPQDGVIRLLSRCHCPSITFHERHGVTTFAAVN
jgi:hypothetical protein